jgi:hypothetical protein
MKKSLNRSKFGTLTSNITNTELPLDQQDLSISPQNPKDLKNSPSTFVLEISPRNFNQ